MSSTNPREKMPPRVTDLHYRARRERRKFIVIFGITFVVFIIVAFWWIVIYSNLLRFERIEVTGNTRMTDNEVATLLKEKVISQSFWGRIFGSDHVFAWPRNLSSERARQIPTIRNISFSRDIWNRRLSISVEEYQFFGTLCARKKEIPQCVWFDKTGFFFEDAFFPEGVLVLRIDDHSRESLRLGEYLYPSSQKMENAFSVFSVVNDLEIPIYSWSIEEAAPNTIRVQILGGPLIYFSLDFPSHYTTQVIRSLIGQKGIANIEYIDFRVQNRVYYKDGSSN